MVVKKSFLFATYPRDREALRERVEQAGLKLPVVLHFRDLGAHTDTTRKGVATTSAKRMVKAADVLRHFRRVQPDSLYGPTMAATKALPMATYAASSTKTNQAGLARLTGLLAACSVQML